MQRSELNSNDWVSITSSVGINQIRKSPYVSDTDGESHAGEDEFPLRSPLSSFNFLRRGALRVVSIAFWFILIVTKKKRKKINCTLPAWTRIGYQLRHFSLGEGRQLSGRLSLPMCWSAIPFSKSIDVGSTLQRPAIIPPISSAIQGHDAAIERHLMSVIIPVWKWKRSKS